MIEPERVRTGVVSLVGLIAAVVCVVLVAISWWLVKPPRDHRPAAMPSPLERRVFAGGVLHGDGAAAQRLSRAAWVDSAAGIAHIPIDLAIDAVVADPSLIGLEAP